METAVLLFQCKDQKGIVAKISDFIFKKNGNIIVADQHSTDPEGGYFFLRIEFYFNESECQKHQLEEEFSGIAKYFAADWNIYYKSVLPRMGVLVSKPDHCLVDLLYLWKSGELRLNIPFVISNVPDHEEVVRQYGLPFYFIASTKEDKKEEEIMQAVQHTSDFLVLARYMQVLSKEFISRYANDIINIHHSFLPSFKGANPYGQAFEKGVKIIGATSHFVTESLDEGPIISQVVESVTHKDGVEELVRKGKNLEKRALSQAVHAYINHRIFKFKNKTIVF